MSHYVCVCYVTNHPRSLRVNTVTILFAHDSVPILCHVLLLLVLPGLTHVIASDGSPGLASPRWGRCWLSAGLLSIVVSGWQEEEQSRRSQGRPLEKLHAVTSAF